jgi:hypothetical protein
MHGLRAGLARNLGKSGRISVAIRASQRPGVVCHPYVPGARLAVGVHRNALNTAVPARLDDPHRRSAASGDEHPL